MNPKYELNRNTLKKALMQLPNYEAPTQVWDRIETTIDNNKNFKNTLSGIQTYRAPEGAWEEIVSKIDSDEENEIIAKPKIRPLALMKYAAVMIPLFLLSIGLWKYLDKDYEMSYDVAYIEDVQSLVNLEDQQLVGHLKLLYQKQMGINTTPYKQLLWTNLNDIEKAKSELKRQIGSFGEEENLLIMLRRLENEESEVLQKMKQFI